MEFVISLPDFDTFGKKNFNIERTTAKSQETQDKYSMDPGQSNFLQQ